MRQEGLRSVSLCTPFAPVGSRRIETDDLPAVVAESFIRNGAAKDLDVAYVIGDVTDESITVGLTVGKTTHLGFLCLGSVVPREGKRSDLDATSFVLMERWRETNQRP